LTIDAPSTLPVRGERAGLRSAKTCKQSPVPLVSGLVAFHAMLG
jgi:hypothetical protein